MLRLFTTSYNESRADRAAEYEYCLGRNLNCAAIGEVCILDESGEVPFADSGKLEVRQVPMRPTYRDFFDWINEKAQKDDVSLIANSDIWFDESIRVLCEALSERECFAMSRWDGAKLFDRNDSQDCWAWRGQVANVNGDFPLGVPRCDNRLLFELRTAGYVVRNPAFALKPHHIHAGQRQEYATNHLEDFVAPPYEYLWPHNLWSLPRTFVYNLLHPAAKLGWRVDRRKLESTLPARAIRKAVRSHPRDPQKT